MEKIRIDKWLWAARFYKTRSLAAEEIGKGRVRVNDVEAKASREVKTGDVIALRQGPLIRTMVVQGVSGQRGGAPQAQLLYAETPESVQARERAAEQRRLAPDPASSLEQGRPTKRNRREITREKDWGSRWSASAD